MEQPKPGQFKDAVEVRQTAVRVLKIGRSVAAVSAITTGTAMMFGVIPAVAANDGWYNLILPFLIGPGLMYGLAALWHILLGEAAHVETHQAKAVMLAVGLVFFGAAVGVSSWFLAAKLGGAAAIARHQNDYLDRLNATRLQAAENIETGDRIVGIEKGAAAGLRSATDTEGSSGLVSGRKAGKKVVYTTLSSWTKAYTDGVRDLQKKNGERRSDLNGAQVAIEEARNAVLEHDSGEFRKAIKQARVKIETAGNADLSGIVSGIGLGLPSEQAKDFLADTQRNVGELLEGAKGQMVSAPVYEEISSNDAVLEHPPLLAWIAAVLIDSLPFLMLILLLLLPRKLQA